MKNVTIAKLLKQVQSYVVCEGLSNRVVEASVSVEHNVLCEVDLSLSEDGCPVGQNITEPKTVIFYWLHH